MPGNIRLPALHCTIQCIVEFRAGPETNRAFEGVMAQPYRKLADFVCFVAPPTGDAAAPVATDGSAHRAACMASAITRVNPTEPWPDSET